MKLPLRWLVLLPCGVLLFVPVLGYYWLESWQGELERSRGAQLQQSADTIAALLANNRDVMARLSVADPLPDTLHAVRVERELVLDGRQNDWPGHVPKSFGVDQLVEIDFPYVANSLQFELSVGADADYLYLFYAVRDDIVVYREINKPSVHRNDHIQISTITNRGNFKRYTIANLQPGEVAAHIISGSGRSLRRESKITGVWRATGTGYNVEIRMPRDLVGNRLSTAVADVDDPGSRDVQFVMGTRQAQDPADLGQITFATDGLEIQLKQLPFAEVELLDTGRQTVARAGGSDPQDHAARRLLRSATAAITHQGQQVGYLTIGESREPIIALVESARQRMLFSAALLLLLGIALSFLIARMLSLRLRGVRSQLEGVTNTQGRISGPMSASVGGDEIGVLSRALADLVNRIRQHNEYLERMASRLGHELRTPVSVVRSSLENLNLNEMPEDQAVYVDRAHDGIERLTNILNKMSEARRLEESLDEEEVVPFNLAEVVSGCVQGYEMAYPDQRFVLSVENDDIVVTGIPELLAQLLDKLVDNAVEFSGAGDPVKIRLTSEGEQAILRVINSGPEIPLQQSNELFESMVSVRQPSAENHLGLGLYIARVIAEFHGATIRLANREDARGAIVTVAIPMMRISARLR